MIKYLTLAIATPFENAQTLLQVQYLPNDDGASSSGNDDSRAAEASSGQITTSSTSSQESLVGFHILSHRVNLLFQLYRRDATKNSDVLKKKKRKKSISTGAQVREAITPVTLDVVLLPRIFLLPDPTPTASILVLPSFTSARI
jgi:hypothetical protein